jgi:hypothetical protein
LLSFVRCSAQLFFSCHARKFSSSAPRLAEKSVRWKFGKKDEKNSMKRRKKGERNFRPFYATQIELISIFIALLSLPFLLSPLLGVVVIACGNVWTLRFLSDCGNILLVLLSKRKREKCGTWNDKSFVVSFTSACWMFNAVSCLQTIQMEKLTTPFPEAFFQGTLFELFNYSFVGCFCAVIHGGNEGN